MAIFSEIIRFFNLKVIVGAVVVKDFLVPIHYLFRILVKLSLKKVVLFRKNLQRTVYMMELAVWTFEKFF